MLAHRNIVTSRPPVVTKHMARVMTPPFENDLHSQNLYVEGGPVFRFDFEVGPFEIRGE